MSKTIFITGSSSGIGLASAKLFYEKGWNVVATMRTPEKDKELKQLDSSRMLILRLDLMDVATIQPALDEGIKKFGKIDILLNNAGYSLLGIFETFTPETIQAQYQVNVFGPMEMIRTLLPHFRENQGGGIINVSAGGGLFGFPLGTVYHSSKFALEGFTESLTYELAPQNIFVKSVIPFTGVTSTEFVSRVTEEQPKTPPHPSYIPFLESTVAKYYGRILSGIKTSSHDVALLIYEAATDGTDKLRYLIGTDDEGFIKARYGSRNDEEYMAHMRAVWSS